MPWAARSCSPHWRPSPRPTGRRGTGGPAASSSPTRWCSWPTTSWPPASCRSCARSSRPSSSPSPRLTCSTPGSARPAPATGPAAATTGFGGLISAATARVLACDGSITAVEIDGHGMPLNLGRSHRVVPPHLRRAVELRDRACVFAGCAAPTYWCDVHHLRHWIFGGETSLENSALLCERHHTKVHHGFRVQRDPGGRWRTFRPDDSEIVIGVPILV